MPPIKDQDQDVVEMVMRAYDYVVSIQAARRGQEDEPAIQKSLDLLHNAFCELHLSPVVQTDGVKPRKEED
jgi:hypothetical protein